MTDAVQQAERRATNRKLYRTTAAVLFGGRSAMAQTLDLSPTGLALLANFNPLAGTEIRIRFSVPVQPVGGLTCDLPGRVVHSMYSGSLGGFKVGIAFTEIDAKTKAAVDRFLGL